MTETKQDVFDELLDAFDEVVSEQPGALHPTNQVICYADRYSAATDDPQPDYDIHTDLDGDQYQLLTGREFIAALADDAMQDEPIGDSYPDISEIVPNRQYRAYISDGNLNGEWEEV